MTQPATPPVPEHSPLPTLDSVAVLIVPMRVRYQRVGRWITGAVVAFFGVLGLGIMALEWKNLGVLECLSFPMTFFFLGLLFSYPIRAVVLNDLSGVDNLVMTGTVYPATLAVSRIDGIAAAAVGTYGNKGAYVVHWTVGDKSYSARFVPLDFKPPVRDVAVVASRKRRVLIVLNGKLYSAKRPLSFF